MFNTLLQILEEGRLTDTQGRSVDFRNTVLIMTSNLGTADLRKANVGFGKADEAISYEQMKEKVNEALKQHFRPEFLNRIDDTIVFHELSKAEVTEIVDLMIKRVTKQLESQGLGLELTDGGQAPPGRQGLRPHPRRPAAAPGHPAPGRGPAVRAPPLEGVPRRRDTSSSTPSPIPETGEPVITFKATEGFQPPPMELAETGPRPSSHEARRPRRRSFGSETAEPTGRYLPASCPTEPLRPTGRGFSRFGAGSSPGAVRQAIPPGTSLPGCVSPLTARGGSSCSSGWPGHPGLTACQVQVDVQADVHADGSGTVTVGLGLDDEALAKVGDLDAQLRVDDLRAAGWTVDGPARQDGRLHLGAGHEGLRRRRGGHRGAGRGQRPRRGVPPVAGHTVDLACCRRHYRVSGTIDLTKGMQTFGDAQLSQLFGGDPFAAGVKKLEQEQGRPVADMVDVRVTVETPGGSRTYTPSLADQEPVAVAVSSSTTNWAGVAGLVLVVARGRRRGGRGAPAASGRAVAAGAGGRGAQLAAEAAGELWPVSQ